ncbi:MAG: TrbI/VirB10 family protein [Sphingomicrobium sp.]|nr:type VI secretion protein [Sphingomonadales bacterium]
MNEFAPAPTRLMLRPIDAFDPRLELDDSALIEASRNAYPVVATQQARKDGFGLMAGAGIATLLGALTFFSMSGSRHERVTPSPAPATAPQNQPALLTPNQGAPVLAPRGGSLILPSVPPQLPFPLTGARPADQRSVAPLMVFDGSAAPSTPADPATAPLTGSAATRAAGPSSAIAAAGGDNDQFATRVGSAGVEVASAQPLANPATTVTQGTLIPAVLETAIDTDLPGYARAIVSRDVRSFDGARVLVPRSSRLIGQYKSGLTAGQTRVYVIWTRLIRPDGVSVALASPAVANDGRSGLDGKVDGHFMKRFGSAFLLSVVGGLSSLGSTVLSGGQSAASVAAQRDSAIPPTIHVAPGQPIRVFTARDLDFAGFGGSAGGQ